MARRMYGRLLDALSNVDRPGDVCTSGDWPLTMPGLTVGPDSFGYWARAVEPAFDDRADRGQGRTVGGQCGRGAGQRIVICTWNGATYGSRIARLNRILLPEARWQSGYAAACKAVDAGSIPTLASIFSFVMPGWRNW